MTRKSRLFSAGATHLLPAAQQAMATVTMQPNSSEFHALYLRVLSQLKDFLATENDVVCVSATGTGAMEAAVSNLTSPGDRVLVLSAGQDGDRWTALAANFGCAVDVVSAPHGSTFSLDAIKAKLKLETRCVFMQATESSTGVQHSVEAVAKLLKETESEALLVVDAIAALGATEIEIDAWSVDALIGASESMMVSPGLSFLALSEKAWDRMEASYNPRYYFDLRKERRSAKLGATAYASPVALIAALGAALDWIAGQSESN